MAYYYKINDPEDSFPLYKGFNLHKVMKPDVSGPKINYDFSKHVLIELLDDTTPEADLWAELDLTNNNVVIHKRMMIDSHRIKCRRAVVICINSDEANKLALRISQTKVVNRCVCAVVIQDLLTDLCLFEKQIVQFGDTRYQQQLLYVSDLSRCRGPSGLVEFLKEKFSPFGTILSVLVCSGDDDGYALPEGVIRFAYLSEAFAAELAFDQYVVGKERLSVTTHHNVLLSQCDLRVRLRDAQRCYNLDCSVSPESFSRPYNKTRDRNNSSICSEDHVVNPMKNLQICPINNDMITTVNNSLDDDLEDTVPVFSQYNFKSNIPKKRHDKSTVLIQKRNTNSRIEANRNLISVPNINITSDSNIDKSKNIDNCNNSDSLENLNSKLSIYASETIPIYMNTTENFNQVTESNCHARSKRNLKNNEILLSQSKLSSRNLSKSDNFFASNNYPDTSCTSLFPSSKSTVYSSQHSDEINSLSESQTVSSNYKQIARLHIRNLIGFKDDEQFPTKNSKKRRKKFTPSQKLCLKSQRTDFSQSDIQSISAKSDISVLSESQQEKSMKEKTDLNLVDTLPDSSLPSKVTDWLSNISVLESISLSKEKEDHMNIKPTNKMFVPNKKKCKNRISVHRAPSIKSNIMAFNHQNPWSDDRCLENEDPNKNSLILTENNHPAPLMEEFKSPLQIWLKQELMSSTNNRIIKSEETLKSVILCATRTKDVVISVGCSHITCDSCYPESTDLLLGFN